eukprot:gene8301-12814_t
MNDHPRNEAFEKALVAAIEPHQSTVVDVGAGAGLLSAIAARAGAAHVTSIEASPTLAAITRKIMHANGLSDRVSVINDFSTHVVPSDMEGQRADVLVSEVLGTLLLGEGALHYMSDARLRLLKPKGAVIPAGGTQYVTVVSSPALQALTHVSRYQNIDLSALNTLKDTDNLVFTKQYGLSLRYMRPTMVSGHLPLFTVDFEHDAPGSVQSEAVLRFEAQCTCAVHALVFHWEAWTDRHKQYNISTWTVDDPNPERDAAWGAGIGMEIDGNKLPLVVRGQEELKESLIAYACCWRRKAVVGGGRDDMVPEVWQRIAEFLMWQKETDPWVEAWSANAMSPVKSPAWALSTSVMARLPTVDDGNWMAFYLASDNYVEQSVETWPHLRQRLLSPPLLYDYAAFIERLDALE